MVAAAATITTASLWCALPGSTRFARSRIARFITAAPVAE
jgi:hypothetical protein